MKKIISIFSLFLLISFTFSNSAYAVNCIGAKRPYSCGESYVIKEYGPPTCPGYSSVNGTPINSGCPSVNRNNCFYQPKALEKGWHSNSTGKYYCKGDGSVFRNGWFWIDGKNYRFDNNGYVYRNRWIKDNNTGSWYFVDSDGASVTGWHKIDDVWYYFNPEMNSLYGVMARNTVMYIDDMMFGSGLFAFNNEGAVVTNSWYDGHYYGSNGVRVY